MTIVNFSAGLYEPNATMQKKSQALQLQWISDFFPYIIFTLCIVYP